LNEAVPELTGAVLDEIAEMNIAKIDAAEINFPA
jgi:hypothetical protein